MADQTIDIEVRAKAVLGEAQKQISGFMRDIGNQAESAGQKNRSVFEGLKNFASQHQASFRAVGTVLAGTVAGLAAVGAGVVALGMRGAAIGDVAQQFQVMADEVGGADAVLSAMRKGVVGTIADFDLMKLANKALGAGLLKTSADAGTLAEGARLLAKRTGGDTVQAFETLMTAIASGRTAQLKQLGVFVDSKAAIDAYAASMGLQVAEMTDADRAAALSAATLVTLREEIARTGMSAADFGEVIEQGKTFLKNFTNNLSVAIAESPVLTAGMRSVGTSLQAAFGGDNQAQIDRLIGLVNTGALYLADFAKVGIMAADGLARGFGLLQLVFAQQAAGITMVGQGFTKLVEVAARVASYLPGVGDSFAGVAAGAREAGIQLGGMSESFRDQTREAWETVKGNSAFHDTLGKIGGALDTARGAMAAAAATTATSTTSTSTLTSALGTLSTANDGATTSTGRLTQAQKEAAKAAEKLAEADKKMLESELESIFTFNTKIAEARAAADKKALEQKDAAALLYLQREKEQHEESLRLDAEYQRMLSEARNAAGLAMMAADEARMQTAKGRLLANLSDLVTSIPSTIASAFTGGGGFAGAFQAIGSQMGTSILGGIFGTPGQPGGLLSGMTNLFGQTLSAFIPVVGSMLGPLAAQIGGWIKGLFGPSAEEREGRTVAGQFRDELIGALTASQQLEAQTAAAGGANLVWAQSTIAIRDAYLAVGLSEEQALDAANRLWEAERQGGGATLAVINEIRDATGLGLTPAIVGAGDAAQSTSTAAVSGFAAIQAQINSLLVDAIGTGDSGLIGAVREFETTVEQAAASGVTDFSAFIATVEDLRRRIAAPLVTGPVVSGGAGGDGGGGGGGNDGYRTPSEAREAGVPWIPQHEFSYSDSAYYNPDGTRRRTSQEDVNRNNRYHTGGWVRAHRGLWMDEVPVIAQLGERMLSRAEVARMGGRGAVDRIAAGSGGDDDRLAAKIAAALGSLRAPLHLQIVTTDGRVLREQVIETVNRGLAEKRIVVRADAVRAR